MHEDNRRDIDHLVHEKTSEPASESVARACARWKGGNKTHRLYII